MITEVFFRSFRVDIFSKCIFWLKHTLKLHKKQPATTKLNSRELSKNENLNGYVSKKLSSNKGLGKR